MFPALAAAVGRPLAVSLTVSNASSSELRFEGSLACQAERGGEGEEGGTVGGAAAAAAAVAAAAREGASLTWAGQPAGIQLVLPPGETVTKRLGLCLLAPGLYQLTLQQSSCQLAAGGRSAAAAAAAAGGPKGLPPPPPNTMIAVHPAFVIAQLV